jgi:NADH-quinone oxidoreductase subunit L
MDVRTLLILIPALPLAAAILTAVLGPRVLRSQSHWPAIAALAGSFLCSALLAMQMLDDHTALLNLKSRVNSSVGVQIIPRPLWTWADIPDAYHPPPGSAAGTDGLRDFRVEIVLRADALTVMMLVMVTFVAMLVAIYSAGYMHGDPGYWRFFAYESLFVFSMTMLVSVSNFALLYVFWEAVGVCSYLLIGFWYQKPEAAAAGKKAFLVNRVGDFGFALGLFLIWSTYGTLNFHDTLKNGESDPAKVKAVWEAEKLGQLSADEGQRLVPGVLGQARLDTWDTVRRENRREIEMTLFGMASVQREGFVGGGVGLAICLLLLVGACGKSAQFPLHVWLPDAMEGPTPVSALIHAATMVTAGVYMIARCIPLFDVSPAAQAVVAVIGGFTALLAALIALTQYDLKRVLAYSTISQLGYMFLAMGAATAAGVTAGMFHLFTHAFFKALLFLGAGSVMHAMGGVIDMRRFGGLRRIMPTTAATFLIGSLALAGMFPFSGFFSKDSIIAAVYEKAESLEGRSGLATLYYVLVGVALVTALLTAFYTFRAFFMTFYGKTEVPPQAGHHAHESPPAMLWPLIVLAVLAGVVGPIGYYTGAFDAFLRYAPSIAFFEPPHWAAAQVVEESHHGGHAWIGLASFFIALLGISAAAFLYLGEPSEIRVLSQYMQFRKNPRLAGVSPYQLSSHKFYFDEIYNLLFVRPLELFAAASYWFDRWFIDGSVNLVGRMPAALGAVMRPLQTGLVQFYALAMVVGLLILLAARLWASG